ncbi:hypothetical protein AAY473_003878 [Plecturocebus cupreus]
MLVRLVLNSWTSGDLPASASQGARITGMSMWYKHEGKGIHVDICTISSHFKKVTVLAKGSPLICGRTGSLTFVSDPVLGLGARSPSDRAPSLPSSGRMEVNFEAGEPCTRLGLLCWKGRATLRRTDRGFPPIHQFLFWGKITELGEVEGTNVPHQSHRENHSFSYVFIDKYSDTWVGCRSTAKTPCTPCTRCTFPARPACPAHPAFPAYSLHMVHTPCTPCIPCTPCTLPAHGAHSLHALHPLHTRCTPCIPCTLPACPASPALPAYSLHPLHSLHTVHTPCTPCIPCTLLAHPVSPALPAHSLHALHLLHSLHTPCTRCTFPACPARPASPALPAHGIHSLHALHPLHTVHTPCTPCIPCTPAHSLHTVHTLCMPFTPCTPSRPCTLQMPCTPCLSLKQQEAARPHDNTVGSPPCKGTVAAVEPGRRTSSSSATEGEEEAQVGEEGPWVPRQLIPTQGSSTTPPFSTIPPFSGILLLSITPYFSSCLFVSLIFSASGVQALLGLPACPLLGPPELSRSCSSPYFTAGGWLPSRPEEVGQAGSETQARRLSLSRFLQVQKKELERLERSFLDTKEPPITHRASLYAHGAEEERTPFFFFFFCLGQSLTMLPKLVSNSWAQAILLLRPPSMLGLQACATMPRPGGPVSVSGSNLRARPFTHLLLYLSALQPTSSRCNELRRDTVPKPPHHTTPDMFAWQSEN